MAFALVFKKVNGVDVNIAFWVSIELMTFFGCFLLLEIFHRRAGSKHVVFVQPEAFMTQQEFQSLVSKGRKLVILDDLVLDVESFLTRHPGGQWNISHNIGKDIGKFFYGGYSIDGNEVGNVGKSGVKHSNFARKAVNKLIIARYGATQSTTAVCLLNSNP
jgi:Cytochrome b5-like Heme/Steroid binding domain